MKQTFIHAAACDDVNGADGDYETIKALHAGDATGSYDSAIISTQAGGKVKATKTAWAVRCAYVPHPRRSVDTSE